MPSTRFQSMAQPLEKASNDGAGTTSAPDDGVACTTPRDFNTRALRDLPVYNALQRVLKPIFGNIHATRLDAYLEDLLERCACEDDPILQRMVLQFELACQQVTVLETRAADGATLDITVTYSRLAERLRAELRRMALAIRQYRAPTSKSTTVVHRIEQLNMADGDQRVNYERAEGQGGGSSRRMQARENKKASKKNDQPTHESRFTFEGEEPEACGSGTLEPAQAVGSDA